MNELHFELKPYADIRIIRHPYFCVSTDTAGPDMDVINRYFEYRKQSILCARGRGDWQMWVFLHVGEYRQLALLEVMPNIPPEKFFELTGEVWTDRGMTFISSTFLQAAFERSNVMEHRRKMMNCDETFAFDQLPSTVVIYRAHHPDRHEGVSWSLNSAIAERIARAYGYEHLTEGVAHKEDIIAYFTRRGEDEIIILPEHVMDLVTRRLEQ